MRDGRLPWEIVETLPWSDADALRTYDGAVAAATTAPDLVDALVGASLLRYWAPALGATPDDPAAAHERRRADIDRATAIAREADDPDLVATAILGRLYACWGPPRVAERGRLLQELDGLRPGIADHELRVRIVEWFVLDAFDSGDLDAVRSAIDTFLVEADGIGGALFTRREILWRANLAMLEGHIDQAVAMNEEAIASTAELAGSPFSFQNVAITTAIAGYLRRDLHELVGAVRSILASSRRVETNWDVGLTFSLSEVGEIEEARERFERLAEDGFAQIPSDLNWLVCIQLLGLVAVNLGDVARGATLRGLLTPFAGLDATHGSGYASYGPVDRTLGLLAALDGDDAAAHRHLSAVLETRAPGPWTTLARADRSRLTAADDPTAALRDAEQAEAELRALGLDERAAEVHGLITEIRLRGVGGPVAHLADATWTLRHASGGTHVRDGVGMHHLVELLHRPGQPIDVVDLDQGIDPSLPRGSAAESTLDDQARASYRRRLAEIDAVPRPSEAELDESQFLRRELSAARHVTASSAELERTRVRVTTAIRRCIDTIAIEAPGLAEHLRTTVATGRRCSYDPVDGVAWRIER